jgi:hypothetical protein
VILWRRRDHDHVGQRLTTRRGVINVRFDGEKEKEEEKENVRIA